MNDLKWCKGAEFEPLSMIAKKILIDII